MSIRQDRINKGLCPDCGKDAAPYLLCGSCRLKAKIGRILRRMARSGAVTRAQSGRTATWAMTYHADSSIMTKERAEKILNEIGWRPDPVEGDKRLRPRLGKIPVDVEKELYDLMVRMARPATIEEIMEAWGRLREKRRTESAAGDLARIIDAKRRRDEKNAKRARSYASQPQNP